MTTEWIRRTCRVLLVLLVCSLAAAVPAAAGSSPSEGARPTVVLVILDGCAAYSLDSLPSEAYLRQAAAEGFYQHARTVFPSSTAAGHAAILTGKWPDENGVTGKQFMGSDGTLNGFSSPQLLEAPTVIERAAKAGLRTAFISGKEGVRSLFGEDADLAVSPASVPSWVLEEVGPPPDESTQYEDYCGWYEKLDRWVIDVAGAFVKEAGPGAFIVLNLAGPDKVGHRFGPVPAPETTQCLISVGEALRGLTGVLEEVAREDWAVVVTADHGMTSVSKAIVPSELFGGIADDGLAYSLDGGVLYAWPTPTTEEAVVSALKGAEGVAEVITTSDERRALLHASHPRSAPIIAIARQGYMFTESSAFMEYTKGSHGTLLDTDVMVPLMVYGPQAVKTGIGISEIGDTVEIAGVLAELLGGLGD